MSGSVSALTNLGAISSKYYLEGNSDLQTKFSTQLASGRIAPSPSMDPAGSAVAAGLEAKSGRLNQAIRTVNQVSKLIESVTNSLASTNKIVTRLLVLAAQSASDTIGDSERAMLQKEVTNLLTQIDNNANGAKWGDTSLLAGGAGTVTNSGAVTEGASGLAATTNAFTTTLNTTYTAGLVSGLATEASVTASGSSYTVSVKIGAQTFKSTVAAPTAAGVLVLTSTSDPNNQVAFNYHATDVTGITNATTFQSNLRTLLGINTGVNANFSAGSIAMYTGATVSSGSATKNGTWGMTYTVSGTTGTFRISNGTETYTKDVTVSGSISGTVTFDNGISLALSTFDGSATLGQTTFSVSLGSGVQMQFQMDVDPNRYTSVTFGSALASSLGISSVDISTRAGATTAQTLLDTAQRQLNSMIADYGGIRSQGDYTSDNLKVNLNSNQGSWDSFAAVNMAEAMMNNVKFKTLTDVASASFTDSLREGMKIARMVQDVK